MNKITLRNTFHNTTRTVAVRQAKTMIYNKPMYPISASTFRRIVNELCGSKDCTCGTTFGDTSFRLVKDSYNFRGHNDQADYYIEEL